MRDTPKQPNGLSASLRRSHLLLIAALAFSGALATVTWAASTATVNQTRNAHLRQQIVVDSRGRTLYVLSPETTHHLLCKSSECLETWPPLTVSSASKLHAGSGVSGKLEILHRAGGKLQVTLRGMPLYTYVGDSGPGKTTGQNLKTFGGTWHVISPTG